MLDGRDHKGEVDWRGELDSTSLPFPSLRMIGYLWRRRSTTKMWYILFTSSNLATRITTFEPRKLHHARCFYQYSNSLRNHKIETNPFNVQSSRHDL